MIKILIFLMTVCVRKQVLRNDLQWDSRPFPFYFEKFAPILTPIINSLPVHIKHNCYFVLHRCRPPGILGCRKHRRGTESLAAMAAVRRALVLEGTLLHNERMRLRVADAEGAVREDCPLGNPKLRFRSARWRRPAEDSCAGSPERHVLRNKRVLPFAVL